MEHEELSKVIRENIDPTTLETPNVRQKALAVQLRRAIDMDPEKAPAMIEMLRTYLATFDNVSGNFTNMEEHAPPRIANYGYWYVSSLSAGGFQSTGMMLTDKIQDTILLHSMGNEYGTQH